MSFKLGAKVTVDLSVYPGTSFKNKIGVIKSIKGSTLGTLYGVAWGDNYEFIYRSEQLKIVTDPNELLKEIL